MNPLDRHWETRFPARHENIFIRTWCIKCQFSLNAETAFMLSMCRRNLPEKRENARHVVPF